MKGQKEIKNQSEYYRTNDLKLQAFLRLKTPNSFIGVNKTNPQRVIFLFKKTPRILKLADGYLQGQIYKLSPLAFGINIDLGKSLIFDDYELPKS